MSEVKKEGSIAYRAHWKFWDKFKYCFYLILTLIKRAFFLLSFGVSIVLFIGGFFIKHVYIQNVIISVAAGFFVYFCTCSCISMRNRHTLRKKLKKKHEVFKYNAISHFLNCAHIPQNPKMVENLLKPEEFWSFFLKTTNHKSTLNAL